MKSFMRIAAIVFMVFGFKGFAFSQVDKLFADYVAALKTGQWSKAESCWVADDIAKSKRLGIEYVGYPAKHDCASPLTLQLDNIRDGRLAIEIDKAKIADIKAAIDIRVIAAKDTVAYTYRAINTPNGWRLCSSLYAETREWKVISKDYLRIHYADSCLVNNYAIDKANESIETTCKILGLSADKMIQLKKAKIDYYLTDERQTKLLTGFDTKGMANLQYDAIITQYLPHPHELVHLLINYDLQKLPLYTAPFIQEGLAVYLGGHWGKSALVIFYFGEINLALEMAKLSDMLTYSGFHGQVGNQDIAYAYAGLLSKYLIEKYGIDKYKQLYRELSGSNIQAMAYSESDIKAVIENRYGAVWADLEKGVTEMAKQYEYCGIKPVRIASWEGPPMINDSLFSVYLSMNGDTCHFIIKVKRDFAKGTILLRLRNGKFEESYRSRLFAEQMPSMPYNGEIYGIQFSPDEAGLYDYRTNTMLAKYVMGFSPSPDYWDQRTKTITFSLDKRLLDGEIQDYRLTVVSQKQK